jgi:hypothetical protein
MRDEAKNDQSGWFIPRQSLIVLAGGSAGAILSVMNRAGFACETDQSFGFQEFQISGRAAVSASSQSTSMAALRCKKASWPAALLCLSAAA